MLLDAYLRNGELFLKEERITEINESTIPELYLAPPREMISGLAPVETEGDLISLLRTCGFSLPRNDNKVKVLQSLTKTKKDYCSICGRKERVVRNKAFIFPFERKIDSIVSDSSRLHFCLRHAFALYSAMAYLYTIPIGKYHLWFFFDAPERDLRRFKRIFKDGFWREKLTVEYREKNGRKVYSLKVQLRLSRYHPNEAFFSVIHEFVKFLKDRNALNEGVEAGKLVRVHLVYGSEQFFETKIVEGTTFEKLVKFLNTLQESGKSTSWGGRHLEKWDSAVVMFYEGLEVPRGTDRSTNTLERERFISALLSGRFDFVLLNSIFMERIKKNLPIPPYYLTWARAYFRAFGGGVLKPEDFEKINRVGYFLGGRMKGTNLERYQWELFRARGFEEFINKLVELQAKLGVTLDLRPVYENREEWKVVKAVLLNGMLNAIYGGERSESD